MAAAVGTETLDIRCPFCVAQQRVLKSIRTDTQVSCKQCKRRFLFQNALPVKKETYSSKSGSATARHNKNVAAYQRDTLIFWLFGLPISMVLFLYINDGGRRLDGIEFIVMYIFAFIGLRVLVSLLQAYWWDTKGVLLYGFIVFEAIGLHRIYYGITEEGMQKFIFLIICMIIGGVLFFTKYSSSSGGDSSDSGSSGCGGGCGGGGCGGCG